MLILSQAVNGRTRITVPGNLLKSGKPLVMDVMVSSIRGSRVRLGYEGPKEMKVHRLNDGVPEVSNSP